MCGYCLNNQYKSKKQQSQIFVTNRSFIYSALEFGIFSWFYYIWWFNWPENSFTTRYLIARVNILKTFHSHFLHSTRERDAICRFHSNEMWNKINFSNSRLEKKPSWSTINQNGNSLICFCFYSSKGLKVKTTFLWAKVHRMCNNTTTDSIILTTILCFQLLKV